MSPQSGCCSFRTLKGERRLPSLAEICMYVVSRTLSRRHAAARTRSFHRIGMLVLMVHNNCDIFLEGAKILHYLNMVRCGWCSRAMSACQQLCGTLHPISHRPSQMPYEVCLLHRQDLASINTNNSHSTAVHSPTG